LENVVGSIFRVEFVQHGNYNGTGVGRRKTRFTRIHGFTSKMRIMFVVSAVENPNLT
jgi:hypothetical protein